MKKDTTQEIRGKSVLLLGYGREGKSTHQWLKKQYSDVTIGIADKDQGVDYLSHLSKYDTVIRSPGVSPYLAELVAYKEKGGYITSATQIFLSRVRSKTIGITGTKGKSTTSSLIAHILASAYRDVRLVGNIGKPMLDYMSDVTRETLFVAELSSHQLADVTVSPHIAVILGIVPEHLDYYPDLETYRQAKGNIVRFQDKNDIVVVDVQNDSSVSLAKLSKGTQVPITFYEKNKTELFGNIQNINAAVAVARAMCVSDAVIQQELLSFHPLPHRLEPVGTYRDISFYNDSLATIPEATMYALTAFGDTVGTLIAGGYNRNLDFSILGRYLAAHPVPTLILFPDTGRKIWESIGVSASDVKTNVFYVQTMEEAVRLAYTHTATGKICLLSPASASYNLFRDYADRGDQFRYWVKKLA